MNREKLKCPEQKRGEKPSSMEDKLALKGSVHPQRAFSGCQKPVCPYFPITTVEVMEAKE